MEKAQLIEKALLEKTAKQGLLSFGNGIKNVIGARHTGKNIRLRIINNWETDATIYLTPKMLLGASSEEIFATGNNDAIGLPNGVPFFIGETEDGGAEGAVKKLLITALNPGQSLPILGSALANEPTQISAISMKSFTTSNVPENTNYGNSLTHYRLSHLEEVKRSSPLNFDAFQNSRDVSTEILKIDLIKNNFNGLISQNDVLAFQINAGTRMDITLHIGARLNLAEYFQRQTKAGNEILLQQFPNESAVDGSCGC